MANRTTSGEKRRAHFTYIWKIESAPRFCGFMSPEFMVQSMEMTKWILSAFVFQRKAFFWIKRAAADNGPDVIGVYLHFSLLDTNGVVLTETSFTEFFVRNKSSENITFPKISAIFDIRENDLFLKDTLTVRCRIWGAKTEIITYELCFASTLFDVHKFSCFWTIKGYSSLRLGGKRTRILDSSAKVCSQLILTLFLDEINGEECILIHLEAPTIRNYFDLHAKIAVIDSEGMVFFSKSRSDNLNVNSNFCPLINFEKNKLIFDKDALLSDDVLLLQCELKLTSGNPFSNKIDDYKLMNYSVPQRL